MTKAHYLTLLFLVLLIGVCARAVFFTVAPPSNSYDDHLEAVIEHRSHDGGFERASPSACWQCYQPPLYYFLANRILSYAPQDASDLSIWKMVQSISFIASCCSMLLCVACLLLLLERYISIETALLFSALVATLPRLLFTSSMATNDALLEMWVSLTTFGYLLALVRPRWGSVGFLIAITGTIAAAYTKQSGLVMVVPLITLASIRFFGANPMQISPFLAFFGLLGAAICSLDEYYRYSHTGILFASNQDFFTVSPVQPPGALSEVSFFSIRFAELLKMPFMGPETVSSFWTEIFGRLWFDYERRFFTIAPPSLGIGATIYLFALPVTIYVVASVLVTAGNVRQQLCVFVLALISAGYVATPILQTIRLPFYSSMKAVFFTAGIIPFACLASIGASRLNLLLGRYRISLWLVMSLVVICGLTLWLLLTTSTQAWSEGVSGPLWPLPSTR